MCVCLLVSHRFLQVAALAHLLIAAKKISGIQGQWQDAVEDLLLNRRRRQGMFDHLKGRRPQREASHPNVWSEVPYFS